MKIRSITVFTHTTLPVDTDDITRLGTFADQAREAYTAAGYEVQTTRIATDLFPSLSASAPQDRLIETITDFEATCKAAGFAYIALGPAGTTMLDHLPAILAATDAVFATSHMVKPGTGTIDGPGVRQAARVIQAAAEIAEGFGNLRFAALANVPPGTPFFPAAYWTGDEPAFAIATESADLALEACRGAETAMEAHAQLRQAVTNHGQRLRTVGEDLDQHHNVAFRGLDFSLAPFPDPEISIGAALETLTGQPLGAAGSLAAAATLTDAVQQAVFPHAGFCGLMMPVLEDNVLAQRAAEGRLRISDLLQWSAVCGTGLDTVPLPGDADEEALARLLFDVASLAIRLHKPLTARLMPLPGKSAGDPVHFDFPYFADGGVLGLDSGTDRGKLTPAPALTLRARRQS